VIVDRDILTGYVTASDAASRLGKSRPTIYRWLNTGKLSGLRIGGTRFVELASLGRVVEGPEAAHGAPSRDGAQGGSGESDDAVARAVFAAYFALQVRDHQRAGRAPSEEDFDRMAEEALAVGQEAVESLRRAR
jgi:excisionase family DNA binding protein